MFKPASPVLHHKIFYFTYDQGENAAWKLKRHFVKLYEGRDRKVQMDRTFTKDIDEKNHSFLLKKTKVHWNCACHRVNVCLLNKTVWQVKCIGIIDNAIACWMMITRVQRHNQYTKHIGCFIYITPLTYLLYQKRQKKSEIPSNNHLNMLKMKNKTKKVTHVIKHNTSSPFGASWRIFKKLDNHKTTTNNWFSITWRYEISLNREEKIVLWKSCLQVMQKSVELKWRRGRHQYIQNDTIKDGFNLQLVP